MVFGVIRQMSLLQAEFQLPKLFSSRTCGAGRPHFGFYAAPYFFYFTVRRYVLHGICYRNSVCLSVRPSVRLSVTFVDCVHMVRPTIMISSPYGSPIILISGDIKFIPKFEGGHPERGR